MKMEDGKLTVYDPTKFNMGILFGSKTEREEMGLDDDHLKKTTMDINAEFRRICLYHLFIGVILLLVQIIGAKSLKSHYTAFMQLTTIGIY